MAELEPGNILLSPELHTSAKKYMKTVEEKAEKKGHYLHKSQNWGQKCICFHNFSAFQMWSEDMLLCIQCAI